MACPYIENVLSMFVGAGDAANGSLVAHHMQNAIQSDWNDHKRFMREKVKRAPQMQC